MLAGIQCGALRLGSKRFPLPFQGPLTHGSRARSSAAEPPNIRKLADMAQIAVSDQELLRVNCKGCKQAQEWQGKIQEIVGWFDQLQAVELDDQDQPLQDTTIQASRLRSDEPRAYANRDAIMEAMPRRQNQYLKVPKIL